MHDVFDRVTAANYLGVSTQTLDRRCKSGEISHFRIGTRVLIKKNALDTFIETRTFPATVIPSDGEIPELATATVTGGGYDHNS